MTVRHIFWQGMPGQSNTIGANPGETGANIAAVPFWKDEIGVTVGPALGSLLGAASGGQGSDYTFGRRMLAKAYRPILVTIGRGSTAANAWIPGGAYFTEMMTSITDAWAAILAAFPGDSFVHHHISDQGEYEARYGYPSPTGPEQAIIDAWATNYGLSHAALESVIGAADKFCVYTNYQLTNQNNAASFRALQRSAVPSDSRGLSRDASTGITYENPDGLHPDTAGYIAWGNTKAALVAGVITMGSLGSSLRTALVNHLRNQSSYTPAGTHYLHLYSDTSCTVPLTPGNAASYAASSNANNTTTWPTPASRMVSSGAEFTFPTPTGTWPTIWGWKLTDSATEGAGTVLAQQGLLAGVPASVATGAVVVAAGALTIAAESNVDIGGLTDDVAHGILGLVFGGTAYAPAWLATTHGSYWAGDPAGAGAQAGSRASITQATTWGAGGTTVAAVSLTQQVTGTYWAEHDAAAAGNLLFTAPRPAAVGLTGTIAPGQLRLTIT